MKALLLGSLGFLVFFNLISLIVASKSFLVFLILIDVFSLMLMGLGYLLIDRFLDNPKSLSKTLKTLKKEHLKIGYGTSDITVPIEIYEAGRYKENVHGTKRGLVSLFFIKDLVKKQIVEMKDDPYDRSSSSVVYYTNQNILMPRIISSKGDIEIHKSMPTFKMSGKSKKTTKTGTFSEKVEEPVAIPTEKPIE